MIRVYVPRHPDVDEIRITMHKALRGHSEGKKQAAAFYEQSAQADMVLLRKLANQYGISLIG